MALSPIGILCATPEELAALRARLVLDAAPVDYGPTQVWTGAHDGRPLALALCGIGKVNAAAAATLLLSVFGARELIFSGVAGGLNPDLPVGAVLLGARLAIHDFGVIAEGAFTPTQSGLIPLGAPRLSDVAPVAAPVAATLEALRAAVAGDLEGPVSLGAIVTADYFLNCARTRNDLRAAFAADAIDMESGAVNQVVQAWRARLYVIRTLSDQAGEDSHLTYPQMAAMAAHNSALCVPVLLDILARA